MKRTILFLAAVFMMSSVAFAQDNAKIIKQKAKMSKTSPSKISMKAGKAEKANKAEEALKFKLEEHNFGTVPEGPSVSYDFMFTNNTDQPVQLESVRASCGCTTPNWSKDPILPGKTSKITATYSTKNRPGSFYKTITVKSTAGQKVLKIKGNVEKAPTSSVPTNNNSMIKH